MKHRIFAAVTILFLFTFRLQAQEKISLEQVVGLAVERNYDVLLAKNNAASTETDKDYVWGAFLPQINGTASTVWNNNNQELRFQDATRNNSGEAESHNTTASVLLNWTLFDGTRMFATRERVAAIDAQGDLLVKNQMVNTVASTIISYYDIVRQKQQLKAIQEQMSVSEERVKLAERKLEVGTGIKPELLQARVDYNEQRAQVLQQESAIAQLKEQLNALVGSQLPPTFDVADTIIIDLDLTLQETLQNVENTSYALRAQREGIRISTLALRESRADYLPTLTFNAAMNYSETDNTKLINPFGALYSQQDGLNYGFTVNIPILNGFNNRRLTQQAKITLDRASLLYGVAKLSVDVSLKNAYTSYEQARRILEVEEETIGLAKENVFIALEGFKRGVTTFIELRTAQQSLADAYNRLIAARYNTKVAETQFLQLSGKLVR